jgi:hypothetical protein
MTRAGRGLGVGVEGERSEAVLVTGQIFMSCQLHKPETILVPTVGGRN